MKELHETPLALAWEEFGGKIPRMIPGWQNALCPLHDDRSPSARVSLEKQAFWCNSCVEGGDVYDLIKLKEGVGFVEAKAIAAERFGAAGGHPQQRNKKRPGRKKWVPPWM